MTRSAVRAAVVDIRMVMRKFLVKDARNIGLSHGRHL
jgi:hypothetical protein